MSQIQLSDRLTSRIAATFGLRHDWRVRFSRNMTGYLFLLPALVLFLTFAWYPIINGFVLSFQHVDLIRYGNPDYANQWVGLSNYKAVFSDPLLGKAWLNTLYFVFLGLVLGYIVPIILAVAINEIKTGQWFFRLAFYVPVILPPMISILLWEYFFDPGNGVLNALLNSAGLPGLRWIHARSTAMPSLVILSTWMNAGGTMLLYLAALQGVSPQMYEAAEMEGAGVFQRLWYITFPSIRTVMAILFVLQIIGTMQVFTEPFVMTDGGPVNATLTVMLLLYRYAFERGQIGWASALGLMLFVLLAIMSALYFKVTRRVRGAE